MRIALVISWLWMATSGVAQSPSWISAQASHGFFIPHRISLPQLLTGHANGFTLAYSSQVDGAKDWHHHLNGPEKGVAFLYLDMGNKEELGSIYSLYPFVDLPLSRKAGPSGLDIHLGVGLAYLDRKYDRDDNFYNQAIGSHLNYTVVLGLGYRYDTERWRFKTSLSMSHASNATIQLPNLGVNVATADVQIAYLLRKDAAPLVIDRTRPWNRYEQWRVSMSAGLRESNSFSREKHGVQELRAIYLKRFSPKMSYLMGMDMIHNKASYQELREPVEFGLDVLQVGVKAGVALEFGVGRLFLQQGIYLAQGKQDLGTLYNRVGGMISISDRWSIDLSLKTHFAKADYLALGVGYLLKEKRME